MRHRSSVGKILHKSVAVVEGALRSLLLVNWYRLCWDIGSGCKLAGRIRRRAFLGDARFGRKCELGHNLVIDVGKGALLSVGEGVSINGGSYISVLDCIEIGDHCRIGEYCSIRDNDHKFSDPDILVKRQGMAVAKIKIGRDVWLGRNVTVQKGVEIGDGSVIGANTFVNKNIPPYSVAVGTPARVVGTRSGKDF